MRKIIFLTIFLLLLYGCASVSQQEAEAKAQDFVRNNVGFFAREENATKALPRYTIGSVSSFQENGIWVVAMHVSASLGNETKKNDLIVKIGPDGSVVEFNGKKLEKK